MPDAFPPEIIAKLGYYVYRLIDPRNGETFYVGKGQGNRVFSHARAEIKGDAISDKLKRIHEIRLAGFEVSHVIHRHGMDHKTALEVEAALMWPYRLWSRWRKPVCDGRQASSARAQPVRLRRHMVTPNPFDYA